MMVPSQTHFLSLLLHWDRGKKHSRSLRNKQENMLIQPFNMVLRWGGRPFAGGAMSASGGGESRLSVDSQQQVREMDERRCELHASANGVLTVQGATYKAGHCQRSIKGRLRPQVCVCEHVSLRTCSLVMVLHWKIETPLLPEPLKQHNLQWFTISATPSIHPRSLSL